MKTSDKILAGSAFTIIILIIILIASTKIMPVHNSMQDGGKTSVNPVSTIKDFTLKGFTGVSVSGAWELEIIAGTSNNYGLMVELPENESNALDIFKKDDLLNIKYKTGSSFKQGNHKIKIYMPELTRIELNGGTKASFSGFKSGNIDLVITGGCELRGSGNTIGNLYIKGSGISYVNMRESESTNVYLDINGVNLIELAMAGGNLIGKASGTASILYHGNAKFQNINQSGIVMIFKK